MCMCSCECVCVVSTYTFVFVRECVLIPQPLLITPTLVSETRSLTDPGAPRAATLAGQGAFRDLLVPPPPTHTLALMLQMCPLLPALVLIFKYICVACNCVLPLLTLCKSVFCYYNKTPEAITL